MENRLINRKKVVPLYHELVEMVSHLSVEKISMNNDFGNYLNGKLTELEVLLPNENLIRIDTSYAGDGSVYVGHEEVIKLRGCLRRIRDTYLPGEPVPFETPVDIAKIWNRVRGWFQSVEWIDMLLNKQK